MEREDPRARLAAAKLVRANQELVERLDLFEAGQKDKHRIGLNTAAAAAAVLAAATTRFPFAVGLRKWLARRGRQRAALVAAPQRANPVGNLLRP